MLSVNKFVSNISQNITNQYDQTGLQHMSFGLFHNFHILKWVLHPNQKLAYFVLYLKIINIFWNIIYMNLIAYCPWNSKLVLEFQLAKWFLSYESKQTTCCLDQ